MENVHEALIAVTGYPIPTRTAEAIALRRGVSLTDAPTRENTTSKAFRLCEADVYRWLADAPNVSQGGQSFNFTDAQREQFRRKANAIYSALDETESATIGVVYGYKGSRL